MVVVIIRTEDGLVKYRDTFPGGPVAFFADVSQETFVVKCAIYVLQTLLGDGVMIYRCYVVWKSVRIIILPCVMWCGVASEVIIMFRELCALILPRSVRCLLDLQLFASREQFRKYLHRRDWSMGHGVPCLHTYS